MDLAFTPKNKPSAKKFAPGLAAICPEIAHKVHNALRLTRGDMQNWAKILGKRAGWPLAGPRNLAAPAGRPCKSTCLKKSAPWRARRASSRLAP